MSYTDLALIYDRLMEDINYNQWVDYLIKQMENHQAPGKVVLDLGCGTGSITVALAQRGYKVTGIDISPEMLTQAEQKARVAGTTIPFYQQDIRDLELDFQPDAVIATFDTLNYILNEQDLLSVLEGIYRNLQEDGLVIFDLNTHYKLVEVLGENVFTYNTENLVYIWENSYDNNTRICQMDLSFFALEEKSGKYLRFDETHLERAYEEKDVIEMLAKTGFKLLGVYGELTFEPPGQEEERIFFVARKCRRSLLDYV